MNKANAAIAGAIVLHLLTYGGAAALVSFLGHLAYTYLASPWGRIIEVVCFLLCAALVWFMIGCIRETFDIDVRNASAFGLKIEDYLKYKEAYIKLRELRGKYGYFSKEADNFEESFIKSLPGKKEINDWARVVIKFTEIDYNL